MKNVVGLFESVRDAEAVVRDLRNAGISDADISFASRNPDAATMEANAYTADDHSEAAEGAGFGATGGTIIGGLTGLLVGLGAIAIPGVGPVVAAGSLATALGSTALGAGIGAATGGLLGALVGAGIPEEDAHVYSEGIRRGGALVMAQVEDQRVDTALDIMERHNVVDIDERGNTYRNSGWSRFDENDTSYGDTGYATRAVGSDQYDRTSNLGMTGSTGLGTSGVGLGSTGMGLGTTDTGYSSTTGGTLDTDYSRSMDTGTTNTGMTGTNYGDADRMPDSSDYDRSSKVGTAGGALAGAATGAAIGSVGGPVGAVVGGVAGAITGGGVGAAGDALGAEVSDNDAGQTSARGTTGGTMEGTTGYGTTGGTMGGMTDTGYSGTTGGTMGGTTGTGYSGTTGGSLGATDVGDNSTFDTGATYGSTQSTMGDAATRRFRSRSYEVGGTTSNTGFNAGSTDSMAERIERATEQGIDDELNRNAGHHDRRDNY